MRKRSNVAIPQLLGVIHLPPLPGSPRWGGTFQDTMAAAGRDARTLIEAGFQGVVIENFGDAPFLPGAVGPTTTAAMTACALRVRDTAPDVFLAINILRNDAEAALAVALSSGANAIRINVHVGARVTDQGIIEGKAHDTLRLRRHLDAEAIALLCDVDVKHSAPLGTRPVLEEVEEVTERGLSDAVLVTGAGTGKSPDPDQVNRIVAAATRPVLIASGATAETLPSFSGAHGVIVGSVLRNNGKAGGPIDKGAATRFAEAFWRTWKTA